MSKMSGSVSEKNLSSLYNRYYEYGGRVTIDSRQVKDLPGCVFFALSGEKFDGNDYAEQALADGASAVVVSRLPAGMTTDDPQVAGEEPVYFLVEDTLDVLQEMAAHHRDVLGLPVLALTGSNGKTTTKELIVRVLGTKYRVAATQGNLNNHIGVPLTLLSFTEDEDIGVVEMGASHAGEIATLCAIARPDLGLITNVGRAHLEGFGGPEGVRRAKGELFDFLAAGGRTVFFPTDDPFLRDMVAERTGFGAQIGYTLTDFGLAVDKGATDRLVLLHGADRLTTQMTGGYNASNVAAALAVGDYFGIDPEQALAAIVSYEPDNNRSQVKLSEKGTGNVLYMDAYNANPSSMHAALDNFLQIDTDGAPKVVILGDMGELGNYSATEHSAVVEKLLPYRDRVRILLVGKQFSEAGRKAGMDVFETTDSFIEALRDSAQPAPTGSHILVKGSRGMALEKIYELL